jgi:hypothetical protein
MGAPPPNLASQADGKPAADEAVATSKGPSQPAGTPGAHLKMIPSHFRGPPSSEVPVSGGIASLPVPASIPAASDPPDPSEPPEASGLTVESPGGDPSSASPASNAAPPHPSVNAQAMTRHAAVVDAAKAKCRGMRSIA